MTGSAFLTLTDLAPDSLCKSRQLDDHPLVRAFADRLLLIACRYAELERSSVNGDQLGAAANAHADGCRGEMRNVDVGADRLIARGQKALDGIERRAFEKSNHYRGREDVHAPAADAQRGLRIADDKLDSTLQSNGEQRCEIHGGHLRR
jgi:hypothetical protein